MKPSLIGASSFAHLLGFGSAASRAEDDNDENVLRAEEENEEENAEGDEDEENVEGEEDEENAEGEEDDENAEGDDEDEVPKSKKSRKAKKAKAEDDDDEKEMKGSGSVAAARRRERARCRAIFSDKAAGARPDVAAHLAFETDLSRKQAVALLRATASAPQKASMPKGAQFAQRMSGEASYKVASTAPKPTANSANAFAAFVVAAGKKARGEA